MSSRASGAMVLPAPLSRGDKGPASGLNAAAATYHEVVLPPSSAPCYHQHSCCRGQVGVSGGHVKAPLLPPQGTFYPSTEEGDPEGNSPVDLGDTMRQLHG
eukprot:3452516-Amphidinium_carterae.1